jgi:DNA processing protein
LRGFLPSLDRSVAIVGTRAADPEAMTFTTRLARELALAGCTIVSGGALGIDTAAHEGALAARRPTIAVLASGFAPAYPPENEGLFQRIVEVGGTLVSEVDDGTPPHRGRFLARNRIVAGLSRVVVVAQAPSRSGALSTANLALLSGIPVITVPHAPWDPRGAGCLALLSRGAGICTSVRDVLSVPALGPQQERLPLGPEAENQQDLGHLGPDGALVLREITGKARHPDEIALRIGMPIRRVQRALLELELSRRIERRPGGCFGRAR